MEALLTSKEVASLLNISEPNLSRWRASDSGPPWINLLGIPRYRPTDLETWINGNLEDA